MKRPTNKEPSVYSWKVQQSAYELLCRVDLDPDRAAYLNHHETESLVLPARFRADREWWIYRHRTTNRDTQS